MADLWVLHIDSLRRISDQSLMKIFQRVQEIWSGQESVTEGQMDGQTDGQTKAISIIPHSLRGAGLMIIYMCVKMTHVKCSEITKRQITDDNFGKT